MSSGRNPTSQKSNPTLEKSWHDKYIKMKYWDNLYDSRFKYFKEKQMTRWLGPYQIEIIYDNGSMRIRTID